MMTSTSDATHSTKPRASMWSDLPDDVFGTVYSKLAAPHDHVRLAVTCRSWQAAAFAARCLSPPHILPWLIYDNGEMTKRRLYCPQDNGPILSFSLPAEVVGKRFVGSYEGGWVATVGDKQQLAIVNLFSGHEVLLSAKQRSGPVCRCSGGTCKIQKIIFSDSPISSRCMLATKSACSLALCVVGCSESGWTAKCLGGVALIDIAFCNGELYGLMPNNELDKFQISVNENGVSLVTSERLRVHGYGIPSTYQNFIVELQGKLALLARNNHGRPMLKVYELSDGAMAAYPYKWVEVTNLGNYALFLGRAWSKAVYVPKGGCGVVRRNYIYTDDVVYVMMSNVHGGRAYQMEYRGNGINMREARGCRVDGGPQSGMWILPPYI